MRLPKLFERRIRHNEVPALEARVLATLLDRDLCLRLREGVAELDLEVGGFVERPVRLEVTALRTRRGGAHILLICPRCRRRRERLYSGGDRGLECRECLGLAYVSKQYRARA